jgi:hypothetical protein
LAEALVANPERAKTMGKAAAKASNSLGGAVSRTRTAVEALLANARP